MARNVFLRPGTVTVLFVNQVVLMSVDLGMGNEDIACDVSAFLKGSDTEM
jgi:hypothetical protein